MEPKLVESNIIIYTTIEQNERQHSIIIGQMEIM